MYTLEMLDFLVGLLGAGSSEVSARMLFFYVFLRLHALVQLENG